MSEPRTSRQALRFLLAGGFNTVTTYALYWLLCAALHPQLAYAIAFVAGIALAYLLNSRWVFGTRPGWRRAASYPLIYLLTYLLGAGLLLLATGWLGLDPRLAMLGVLGITTPVSFLLNRALLGQRAPA